MEKVELGVGLTLETMEEMKDQYCDKQREHLRNYRLLQVKMNNIQKHTEKIIVEYQLQNRLMGDLEHFLYQYRTIDPDIKNYCKYISLHKQLDLDLPIEKNKMKYYQELGALKERMEDIIINCDAINHEPLDDSDLASESD